MPFFLFPLSGFLTASVVLSTSQLLQVFCNSWWSLYIKRRLGLCNFCGFFKNSLRQLNFMGNEEVSPTKEGENFSNPVDPPISKALLVFLSLPVVYLSMLCSCSLCFPPKNFIAFFPPLVFFTCFIKGNLFFWWAIIKIMNHASSSLSPCGF